MNTREALVAAVAANPADDLPKLVLADWFEENGDPERAEYIRIGVEQGKRTAADDCPALVARAKELFDAHALRWFAPFLLALDPHRPPTDYQYKTDGWRGGEVIGWRDDEAPVALGQIGESRGLIDELRVDLAALPPDAAPGRALQLETVQMLCAWLHPTEPRWNVFTTPGLARLGRLRLYGYEGSDWAAVFEDPNLSRVVSLETEMAHGPNDLEPNLPAAAVGELVRSPLWGRLEEVRACLGNEGLRALADAPAGPTRLTVEHDRYWDDPPAADGSGAFSNSPLAAGLRRLRFGSVLGLTEDALAGFGRTRSLRRLDQLEIELGRVSGLGLRMFAECDTLKRLPDLALRFRDDRRPTDDDLRGLLHIPVSNRGLRLWLSFGGSRPVPDFLRERFGG